MANGEHETTGTPGTIMDDIQPTKAVPEHTWLKRFLGTWEGITYGFNEQGEKFAMGNGTDHFSALGDLWVISESVNKMGDGDDMHARFGFGYDVSFKHYAGFFVADASSHHWKYSGRVEGESLILDCVGPDMAEDGKTANYRDIHTFLDADHRQLESVGEMPDGTWMTYMVTEFKRV